MSPCGHNFLVLKKKKKKKYSQSKKVTLHTLYMHAHQSTCPVTSVKQRRRNHSTKTVSLDKNPKNQEEFLLLHFSRRKATVSKYRSTPWKSECSKGLTFSKSSLESSVVNRWETALVCGTSTCSSPSQC